VFFLTLAHFFQSIRSNLIEGQRIYCRQTSFGQKENLKKKEHRDRIFDHVRTSETLNSNSFVAQVILAAATCNSSDDSRASGMRLAAQQAPTSTPFSQQA